MAPSRVHVGSPPYTDQTVSSSMADASIVTDAYRLGHPAVKVLAQTSPRNVQSGLSKVLHEGLSCAAMGPHPFFFAGAVRARSSDGHQSIG